MGTEVDTGKLGKSSPSTANIEQLVARLETNLLADDSELVILELFEGLLLRGVRDDTRGVDHARAKEPPVEVITSVVVVTDLFLICKTLEGSSLRNQQRLIP
jgi:hypothetical protein